MAKVPASPEKEDDRSLGAIMRSNYDDGMFSSDIGLGVFKTGFPTLDYGLGFPVDIYKNKVWDHREFHKGVLMGSYLMLVGDPATGKEQPYSARIPTPTGYKKMGDLKLGDLIFDREGNPTKVVGIFEQGVKDIYRMTLQDGRTVDSGLDHLWEIIDTAEKKSCNHRIVTTRELIELLKVPDPQTTFRYQIPTNGPIDFEYRRIEVDPWSIGAYLGCGHSQNGLLVLRTDQDTARVFANKNKYEFAETTTTNEFMFFQRNKVITAKQFLGIYSDLLDLGEDCYQIPGDYLINDLNTREALLGGIWDSCSVDQNRISHDLGRMVVYSDTLAHQIQWLLWSFGIQSEITHATTQQMPAYEILVHHPEDIPGIYWRGSILDLKQNIIESNHQIGIHCIEKLAKQDLCRCILVDNPEHLYLTEDFIVTHNTTLGIQIAANIIRPYKSGIVHHLDMERACIPNHVMELTGLPRDDFDELNPDRRYILSQDPISHEGIQKIVYRYYKMKMANQDKLRITLDQLDGFGNPIVTLQPTVILTDSIPMIGNVLELGDSKDEKKMEEALTQMDAAQTAGAFKRMMKMILGPMKEANIFLIGISHMGVKIQNNPMIHNKRDFRGLGQDELIAGGKANTYGATNILKLDRRGGKGYTVENGDGFNGFDSLLTVVKSRTTFDAKQIPVTYDCEHGFDSIRSTIQYGVERGLITGNRASMKFARDPECKFSYVHLYEEIKKKPEILINIKKYIIEDLESPYRIDHEPDPIQNIFLDY